MTYTTLIAGFAAFLTLFWICTRRNPLHSLAAGIEWLAIVTDELPGAVVCGWVDWKTQVNRQWQLRTPIKT